MIQIKDKINCSGCSACYNICPHKAIEMHEDEEGFLYPKVYKSKCVNCNLCDKVCQILNKDDIVKAETETLAYVAYNKENIIRDSSTSGGVFTSLAEQIIEMNGVVFGASYNNDFSVEHTYTEEKENLKKFRGSKYVQSYIGDAYRQVKNFLENDRYVLFSGTPCQIEGLNKYLGKKYKKLYLVDLVCHGVPSPKVIREYIKFQEKKYKSKIIYMSYREKTYGAASTTMTMKFENGKEYNKGHESDFILGSFMNGLISRPSCYNCKFKTLHRNSDITLGDVWNIEKYDNEFSASIGNTGILVHTKKGKELLLNSKNLKIKQEKLIDIINANAGSKPSMITESAYLPNERKEFFRDLNKADFSELIKKYYPQTLKRKIKSILKNILYRIGLLEKIKK